MKAVMLMFDSLNRKMLQPYGCDWVNTPNFQRLADRSVQFNQCYVGSLPCMPARRELHTGRYNFLHRSWGPIEPFDDSMPEILKQNGIYTHLVSDHVHYWEDGGSTYHNRYNSWENIRGQEGDKWKCLPELLDKSDNYKVQNKDGLYFHSTRELHRHDFVNRQFMVKEEDTPLAKTFKNGLEFINSNCNCDNWFLQIECFDPHEPFFVPEKYKKLFPDTYEGETLDWPPYHNVTEENNLIDHYKKQYAALLAMCDEYLGKLLDKFDEFDLWKDTMLIVNTDHGYLLGEHGWWSKIIMPCYDEIAHTPLFIHDPRFSCEGEERGQIVQTIDLPATLLEFFGLSCPKDMQGKPIRTIIEKNESIRDYALFGIHGAHINIFDGKYVYMKAPNTAENTPLFEYTTMPIHMRNLFSVEELKQSEAIDGSSFEFLKGCPVWKIKKGNGNGSRDFSSLLTEGENSKEARYIDNNSMVNSVNFGTKLFDLENDPNQLHELFDLELEAKLANTLRKAMIENESPEEQYERIGLSKDNDITIKDIELLYQNEKNNNRPSILKNYEWTIGAINTYRALMKFLPKNEKKSVDDFIINQFLEKNNEKITARLIINLIPNFVKEEHVEMIQYFVELASRTA